MNGWDWLILCLVALAVGFALWRIRCGRRSGGCGCGCAGCSARSAACGAREGCGEKKDPKKA